MILLCTILPLDLLLVLYDIAGFFSNIYVLQGSVAT